MKKMIKASKSDDLLETFMRYHNDENNMAANEDNFDKMYDILEKYDDSNKEDTVDIPFSKATREDQERMVNLIKPPLKPGEPGYAKEMLQDALQGEYGTVYGDGIIDTFAILVKEGLLNENEFKVD